jgi:membrane protease subunit HflK
VVIDYFLAGIKFLSAKRRNPQPHADGCHSKMDMYCSLAVLIGLLGSFFGMPGLDRITGVLAMVLIIISASEILLVNIRFLRHTSGDMAELGHTHEHTKDFNARHR